MWIPWKSWKIWNHDELFCFWCVEQPVVVLAPLIQGIHLHALGRLLVILDEANHQRGVICKLDDDIRAMRRSAVVDEEGVEEQTQHSIVVYLCLWWVLIERC